MTGSGQEHRLAMAGAAALGLWAGVAAALADATLTVAGSPRVVPPPSGARVFLWALLAYPAAGAVACALLARAFGAARRAEPARARAVALAAVSSTALLAVAVAAARRWEAGVPSPAAYAGTAAAFALAAAALTPATWRAVRRGPSRRGVAIALGAWAALAAGAFALASRPVTSPAAGPERPVIVLVTVDTLRADALGCYGNPSARTPAIDRLAAEGARFADAQAQSSWTLTAHASIMTGLTVAQHGADAVSLRLSGDHETIAATLARRGFRTAAIVSSVYTGSRFGFARGFDRFDEEMAPAWTGLGACRLARLLGVAPRGWATSDERRAGPVAAAALDVLRRAGSGPLFLWLHFFDPHSDYDPPPPFDVARAGYSGPFDGSTIPLLEVNRGTRTIAPADLVRLRSLYDGEVAYLDSEIGALLAGLDRLGLAGRTAIVLTADHGESFHEHGTMLHESLYQEVLHVPLLLWRPGLVPAGRVVGATVRQMDVAPTVAELAGVPWAVPGSTARSLLPVALGSAEPPRPAPAERQVGGLGSPVRGEQVALVEWPWKLIADTGAAPQLFDLAADPLERNNLAWVERPRVDAMSAALAGERAPSGRPARPEPWLLRRLRSLGYVN